MDKIEQTFENVRNEVLKKIFPDTWDKNDYNYYHETETDENWNSRKPWYENPRVNNPMNSDTRGLRKIQEKLRENDGVYITASNEPLPPSC